MPTLDCSHTLMSAPGALALSNEPPPIPARGSRNVARLVLRHATESPDHAAFVTPAPSGSVAISITTSYATLGARVASITRALQEHGVGAGDRVVVLLPMSVELYAIALAILASGATLTLVDGRQSRRRLLAALSDAEAHAVVAPTAIMRWWPFVPALRRARRFTVGGHTIGCFHLSPSAADDTALRPTIATVRSEHPAILSFTSGSTGRPKAIVRTHGVLVAQHEALAASFAARRADVNLPGFPMAALHNLCCGATTVLPAPGGVEREGRVGSRAEEALALVRQYGVTSLSAAPALLDAMASAVLRSRCPAPSVRRIVSGGGPVSRALCDRVLRAFPGADSQIVYGATEAEPIATVSMTEALVARGSGFLVGRPAAGTTIAIQCGGGRLVTAEHGPSGVGEVLVRGPHVIDRPARDEDNERWHHTGDLGAFDARGRLWLLGRVASTVRHHGAELYPYAIEAEMLAIDGVRAAALVGHEQAPDGELAVALREPADRAELERIARACLTRLGWGALRIRICSELPMDQRHDSKVDRVELARRLARRGR